MKKNVKKNFPQEYILAALMRTGISVCASIFYFWQSKDTRNILH